MAWPIRLDLETDHLSLSPGESARLLLTLRNTSDVVEHLHVEVRGLPRGAQARSEPETVKLLPAAVAECALTISLPSTPLADAGVHVLGVLVRSSHRREVSRCEELRLDVPPQPALALAVEPELVRAGSRARYAAVVVNAGNVPLTVGLAGTDPERSVDLRFTPHEVLLRPGHEAAVAVTAAAPRPWTGQEKRRALSLTASGPGVSAASSITFVQPPRLPPVVLRSVAGLVSLLIAAGAVVLAGQLAGGDDAGQEEAGSSAAESAETAAVGTTPPVTEGGQPTETSPTEATEATETTEASTESSPTPTPTPRPTGEPTLVPFADGEDGPGPRLVEADLWQDDGVVVSAAPGTGLTPPGCASADRVAVHGAGNESFVTAATDADAGACTGTALSVRFTDDVAPVTGVLLEVPQDGEFLLVAETTDGPQPAVEAPSDARLVDDLQDQTLLGFTIAGLDGADPPATVGLTRLQFVPAR